MEAEIIQFSNYLKNNLEKYNNTSTNKNILIYLEKNLSEEDYLDFLEALVDIHIYNDADEDIKDLVDAFYGYKKEA